MNLKERIGQTVKSSTAGKAYFAYIPKPLPPKPALRLESIYPLLDQANIAIGRLDGIGNILPDQELFLYMYIRKEAVLSSQIEGTQSSLQDVIEAEARVLDPEAPDDVDEVFNYINAMRYGLKRLEELPLSVRLIREIHERLLKGVRGHQKMPGELRSSQNWIGPGGATIRNATYVPPPPHEVGVLMSDMEQFIHTDSELPLLVKISLVHAQFETIHPFLDGNGRIGRLLITFMLCERDVLHQPVLYLSTYFKRYRQEYYDRLQAIREEGAWEAWLRFFLRGVKEVSHQAAATARDILLLREKHRDIITTQMGRAAGNGYKVLERLYDRPIVTVNQVKDLIGTGYAAANNLVAEFEQAGIVEQMSDRRRNRRFIYRSYLDLFAT